MKKKVMRSLFNLTALANDYDAPVSSEMFQGIMDLRDLIIDLLFDDGFISPKKKVAKKQEEPQADFISTIKDNPAYKGIDIDKELAKMQAWTLTPNGKGRRITKKFIINWLNKVDAPVEIKKKETPKYIPKIEKPPERKEMTPEQKEETRKALEALNVKPEGELV